MNSNKSSSVSSKTDEFVAVVPDSKRILFVESVTIISSQASLAKDTPDGKEWAVKLVIVKGIINESPGTTVSVKVSIGVPNSNITEFCNSSKTSSY